MAGTVYYYSLYCREMAVDQRIGELRYETASLDRPVAQFIGPKPLSEKCNRFSIEIANSGMKSFIAIGLCNRRYPANRQPGWYAYSIGYHADDGGIYHESGSPLVTYDRVPCGSVMECCFNFNNNTVSFYRDDTKVFTSRSLQIPPGGFYPIVGLHSYGEVVCLLEVQPWTPDFEPVDRAEEKVCHSLFCREAKIDQDSRIVRYDTMDRGIPVGQFVSECPLSPQHNRFTFEIASQGQKCCITIGLVNRRYPSSRQPGWLPNSIAYHADDGGIFNGKGKPCASGPRARAGDTMSCELNFSSNVVTFFRNDVAVFRSPPLRIPPGGYHAAVGFHSHGEAVCLLETGPWRSAADDQFSPPPVPEKYYYSVCADATLNQASGRLTYSGGTGVPVAQLISKCPLTPEVSSFSIEILNQGRKSCIAIGVCPQYYPSGRQPGWDDNSIGYHADNGGVYHSTGSAIIALPIARQDDVMKCELNFTDNTVSFSIKGQQVYQSPPLTVPRGGFHAIVGLHSVSESVRLLEVEPWRKEDIPSTPASTSSGGGQSMPICGVCMENAVNRFLIPCGHTFCTECVEEWSLVQKNCPSCRVAYQEVKSLFFG